MIGVAGHQKKGTSYHIMHSFRGQTDSETFSPFMEL